MAIAVGDSKHSRSGRAKATLKREDSLPSVYGHSGEFHIDNHPLTASIVIPFYDRPLDMVKECLESAAFCSPMDTEIIVVDDGSRDKSIATDILGWMKVLFVRFPHNRGVSAARNAGNSLASGDVIVDLDSDDILIEGGVDAILREIEAGADYVYGNAIRLTEQGKEIATDRPEWEPNCIFKRGCFFVGLKGYRRSLWQRIGGFDESLPAAVDMDFALRAEEAGAVFARAPEQLVFYREHEGQISFARFEEQNECAGRALEEARMRRRLSPDEFG